MNKRNKSNNTNSRDNSLSYSEINRPNNPIILSNKNSFINGVTKIGDRNTKAYRADIIEDLRIKVSQITKSNGSVNGVIKKNNAWGYRIFHNSEDMKKFECIIDELINKDNEYIEYIHFYIWYWLTLYSDAYTMNPYNMPSINPAKMLTIWRTITMSHMILSKRIGEGSTGMSNPHEFLEDMRKIINGRSLSKYSEYYNKFNKSNGVTTSRHSTELNAARHEKIINSFESKHFNPLLDSTGEVLNGNNRPIVLNSKSHEIITGNTHRHFSLILGKAIQGFVRTEEDTSNISSHDAVQLLLSIKSKREFEERKLSMEVESLTRN